MTYLIITVVILWVISALAFYFFVIKPFIADDIDTEFTNNLTLENNEEFGLLFEPKEKSRQTLKPVCPNFKLLNYPLKNEIVITPDFINGRKVKNNFAFTCMHFYDCKNYDCLTCSEWEIENEEK